MIKRLIQIFNVRGGQALCDAAAVGNAQAISDLLAAGANHAFSDFEALRLANIGGFSECVKILAAREHSQPALQKNFLLAVLSGRVECARHLAPLIVYEAPDASAFRRPLALFSAGVSSALSFEQAFETVVRRGDVVGARLLLPHVSDDAALSGLREAAWRGHSECIKLLLHFFKPTEATPSLPALASCARGSRCPDSALPIDALILSMALSKTTPEAPAAPSPSSPRRPRL